MKRERKPKPGDIVEITWADITDSRGGHLENQRTARVRTVCYFGHWAVEEDGLCVLRCYNDRFLTQDAHDTPHDGHHLFLAGAVIKIKVIK